MATIYGEHHTKAELLSRVGSISQLCGVKLMELKGGKSEGVSIARIWTGSGLDFDVNLSRGIGLGAFRFKGMSLSWISATGDVAPCFYEPHKAGLDRSYAGGLMHNSGLRQVGAPCEDEGEELGLHGRISNIPADQVHLDSYWNGDDYIVSISGKVREVSALGENIVLTRKIQTKLGSNEVLLEDTIENEAPTRSPFMLLYHTNFGFPLIDQGTRLVIPSETVINAADGSPVSEDVYGRCSEPTKDKGSQIYFHTVKKKNGHGGYLLMNEKLELGLEVRYEIENLPNLIHWVNLEAGRYVMEVGPSNCKCFGRKAERDAGTLQFLEPGEVKNYRLSFSVIEGMTKLTEAEQQITRG